MNHEGEYVEVSGVLSVLSPAITALVRFGRSTRLATNSPMLKRTKLAGVHRPDGTTSVATQVLA